MCLVQICKTEAFKLTTNEDEILVALAHRNLPVSLENMAAVEKEAYQVLNQMSFLNWIFFLCLLRTFRYLETFGLSLMTFNMNSQIMLQSTFVFL